MAQLDAAAHATPHPTPAPTPHPPRADASIPAATQLLAIAWLRWRIFVNGFRRRQTGPRQAAGLILGILLRMIVWPMFALFAIGPAIASGVLAWMAVHDGHPSRLSVLFAGIAVLWQFVAVNGSNIAASAPTFDPASLLRFPLRFGRYLILRLMLGLLTPSTIIGTLALLAAAIGIAVADRSLALAAFPVLALYAAMNLFFSRMLAAWMERWLSSRRAREIFGGLMALLIVAMQYPSLRRQATHGHPTSDTWIEHLMHGTNHFLLWLPPGYATGAILPGNLLPRFALFAALAAWTALFFTAFALRLHKQFLGEFLSEGAPPAAQSPRPASRGKQRTMDNVDRTTFHLLSPTVAACLRKEWVYLRGNSNQLIAMFTPLIFVAIFARGILARHPSYLLSGSVGYAIFGLLVAQYNIFGPDAAGVQFYLFAPIRLRDVILAKNLASLALLTTEAVLAWTVAAVLAGAPIPLAAQLSAFFWIVFVLFLNLTIGTWRSIASPRKFTPGQARALRTPPAASKTSGLLILAILFGSLLLELPVTLLCRHFHNPWLASAIFAPLAAAAIAGYALFLANADHLILTHRDLFAEELCSA